MARRFWYLFMVLIVEGSSLMAVELIGAKLLAPFYGSSLYVWSAVLAITAFGLTLGYFFGGQLSSSHPSEKLLVGILGFSAVLVVAMPATAGIVIRFTASMALIPAICVASFMLVVPPMFCFGLVGPMVVRLMTQKIETLGNVAGTVYFTSTLGGIIATFGFGLFCIPQCGLTFSAHITALALAVLPITFIIRHISNFKNSKLTGQSPESDSCLTSNNHQLNRAPKPQTQHSKLNTYNTVFLYAALEGGTVMAVELMGARMLAPWFGSSLYVWATVIGITLLGLALGYFAGGQLADRYSQLTAIHWVILCAAVLLVLMHSTSQWLTLIFIDLDLRIAVVIVTLFLILPPLLFLGMIPTLLIRHLTYRVEDAGGTTGRVFTISSASGILVLPLIGFVVIPTWGITNPSIVTGLLVGVVPLVRLLGQKKYPALFFALFMLLSFSQRQENGSAADLKVLNYSEGLLGQILVADIFKNAAGAETNDRILFINRMGQTNINGNTQNPNWTYLPFSTALAGKLPAGSQALLLGLGGGTVANALKVGLQMDVDAVELDPRIARVAQKYFNLNPGVKIHVDDARHYLETTKKTYDLIFFDLFRGETQPPHVLTVECFKKAGSLLNKGGFMIVNFNGFLSDETGKPGRSLYSTLMAAGFETKILPTPGKEEERNTLFIASSGIVDFHRMRYPLLHLGREIDFDSLFLDTKTLDLKSSVVFTDDKPDLERMNLEANSIWRKAYNRIYSKRFLGSGVPMFK